MKNRRHARRIKRLALICTLCTIILVVSTYAWFVGMKTVNVSTFDVEIAATDGLSLSIDGKNWSETVTINKSNFSTAYDGNTNTWTTAGLIPVSTVGVIDTTSSNLVMYEKGSLTTTKGGYRLMASRVNNNTSSTVKVGGEDVTVYKEADGYVVFDLFVRNLSGNEYYTASNKLNEEAIYLTQDSKVNVVTNGSDKQDKTGIENSVRVAFAQIGRVKATKGAQISDTEANKVRGISCLVDTDGKTDKYDSSTGVTGVCSKGATIWEPNDKAHVANAISWYGEACKARTGATVTAEGAYSTSKNSCTAVTDGVYSKTYAIRDVIDYTDNVDVYDGTAYNTYTGSIYSGTNTSGKLFEYDYFTDTEKMYLGTSRPEFFSLAPNSITKVRVYVYLEGQDIDNYDFASLGKKIQVSFGFTKERFFDSDINYDGPMSITREDGSETNIPTTKENQA